jgi:hypothetical protein
VDQVSSVLESLVQEKAEVDVLRTYIRMARQEQTPSEALKCLADGCALLATGSPPAPALRLREAAQLLLTAASAAAAGGTDG